MKSLLIALAIGLPAMVQASDPLADGFAHPPESTKPWCYWYWISDHTTKEGITKDLEAMARVGIGEALIGNIFLDDVPAGSVKVLSPEWWGLVGHAMREGGRVGVNIGMFNCPGWSQSGGPWIQSTQAMRYLAFSETRVAGPVKFVRRLPVPKEPFQDVAVLAFPAPAHDQDSLDARAARVNSTPPATGLERLLDGDPSSVFTFPDGAGRGSKPFTIQFELPQPLTARSLEIVPGTEAFGAEVELEAAAEDGRFATVRRFKCDRSNMSEGVGFLPRGAVAISFPAVTATRFRLGFTGCHGSAKAGLAEVVLSGAARLEGYVEKQLGKMHPTPLPLWDTYLWRTQAEPEGPGLAISREGVRDLSGQMAGDGTLTWEVPAGDWVVLRLGMTPTGMRNSPASPEGRGLEVDKMNRSLAQYHFNAFIGEALRRVPPADRAAFKQVVADSYEMGSENWTDGFERQFRQRYGYDPRPWLPVLTGRLVESADRSERFLWDLRRLVADRVATDYVGGLRAAANRHGLGLWLENYGHWGFPSEFLKYGGESDRVSGEYWVTGDLGSIELRAASSCANTYGKKFVSAEAFTGGPAFQNAPGALKARGDWSFCEGVNHFVLHVYIQQPWEDKIPGVNAWFGTEFNRHNTWFERSRAWVDYLRRCCWLLQQGNRVADVAYFIGEDAPKMTGARKPELPAGYDFDYINAEVIEKSLRVGKDGRLTLPHGTAYRVLVLPEQDTMRPELLRKIRALVKGGATVVGPPPSRSPSGQHFPACDVEVRELAAELWGSTPDSAPGERRFGKGRLVWGKPLAEILAVAGAPPDFQSSTRLRFTHRHAAGTDLYFVANPLTESVSTTVAFRAGTRRPELWWPDTGRVEQPAVYDADANGARLPLALGPQGSVFVVFRQPAAPADERIVSVTRDGQEVSGTTLRRQAEGGADDNPNNFSFAAWIRPAADTTLVGEVNRGVVGLDAQRNDALAAPHGDSFGGNDHAGCGLAVGRNGLCVFEHGANYFAPTLVYAGPITNWTHVAVVYRDGRPHLFLDGVLSRTGLRSEHRVHSGAGAGGLAQFRGQLGRFEQFGRALTDREAGELARSMARPDKVAAGAPIEWIQTPQGWEALARQAGHYTLTFADGRRRELQIGEPSPAFEVKGPWEVRFAPGWGAPEHTTFEHLVDWTLHADDGIRFFSGKATYRARFDLPPDTRTLDESNRLFLDLGQVRDLATVRLNGKEVGTLWLAPWQLDLSGAAKPGENVLEVEVVNVWNNRLAGDQRLPAGQRRTFLLAPTVRKDSPLLPAGLIGPVTLQTAQRVTIPR